MKNKLNIGILGCADIANRMVAPALLEMSEWNLVGAASRDGKKADEFAKKFNCKAYYSYDELINSKDVDALYVPLPTGLHFEWISKSILTGKHVLSEKSITESLDKTLLLTALAKKNNIVLFENFMFQYHSQFKFVRDLVSKGEIGDLRTFRSNFSIPMFKAEDNIRYKKELGGGALLDVGAYTLMGAQIFLNDPKVLFSNKYVNPVYGIDFGGSILLRDKNGIDAQCLFGFDHFYQNNIELCGTKGKITMERAYTAGPGIEPKILLERQGESHPITLPSDHHFKNILADFNDAIHAKDWTRMTARIENQAKLLSDVARGL